MTLFEAYIFQYRLFILSALMLVWVFYQFKKYRFCKNYLFKVLPLIFAFVMLVLVFYLPIAISSPTNHTLIHPGDSVALKVELTPRFLSNLYPWVGLSFYSCHSCRDSPPGVTTEGALTGSPYSFTVNVPADQPAGEIFVDAYASIRMGDRPAIRSAGVGLVVK